MVDELELRAPFAVLAQRAFYLLFFAAAAWFADPALRYLVWFLVALLVRDGLLEELRPVRYLRGLLERGGERRPVEGIVELRGVVVLGLWPRIAVGFSDGERWWLPVVANWYLLWDRLRAENPRLPDWRETPLCLFFLARTKSPSYLSRTPGELVELAEALALPSHGPGFFFSLLVAFALSTASGLFAPGLRGPMSDFLIGLAGGFLSEAFGSLLALRRLRVYQEGGWCRRGGRL